MRTTIFAIIAVLSVAVALPAQAESTSKREAIGFGSGALVGAAAGGPAGFIIGAAVGAVLGDRFHQKNEQIDELSTSLAVAENSQRELENNLTALDSEIRRLRDIARPELVSLMQAGIAMDLLFRTDEAVLSAATQERLTELAGALASMPGMRIQVDGFADERGATDYNQALSERRASFIRDQFIAAGVAPERIDISAHGESAAQDDTLDSYALERRVSVTLFIDETPSVASRRH